MKSYIYFLFILTAILSASCSTKELIPIKSSNKEIKSFSFRTLNINANIDSVQRNITATLPFGTDASLLTPTITISPKATISPASDIIQNFTKPVLYIVTAEDGSSQTFTVNIIAPPKSSKPTSTLVSSNIVKLQWAKIDNIKSYKIYRNNIVVYEGSNIFFEDIGLTAETTYI